jgi:hypothetical protein
MEEANFNMSEKKFRIHWHGYNSINDIPQKDNDFYIGMSWVDAVNQFLDNRFSHGPRFFFIDYYEEWDVGKEDRYDV